MHHSEEATGRFVVARGQAAKRLKATEKAFDFVAVAVQVTVNHALDEAVLLARNHRLGSQGCHAGREGGGIRDFIGQYLTCALGGGQQVRCPPPKACWTPHGWPLTPQQALGSPWKLR